jgi:hypothetical protein
LGIEDEIRYHLHQGISPKDLIEQYNYKKSTVYKVYESIKTYSEKVNPPQWEVENIHFNKHDIRYMPGEAVSVTFYFRNKAKSDLYLISVGIQTEWMVKQGIWYSNQLKVLLRPNEARFVSISFPIPDDTALGEYELLFGVEGQRLPVGANSANVSTEWSDPLILHVKHPLSNNKVFLSHSVTEKFLVRELEKKLDQYGIQTYIGEDISQPGAVLDDKFKRLIEASTFFIALLTRPALESPWVNMEINYAQQLNKPMILLKDRSVDAKSNLEWVEFSSSDSSQHISEVIMTSLNRITSNTGIGSLAGAVIGIGLLALLVAALTDR